MIPPGSCETIALMLDPMEYQDRMVDMGFIKITWTGFVQETMQSFVDEYDFRFEKPRFEIQVRCLKHIY